MHLFVNSLISPHLHLDDFVLQLRLVLKPLHHVVEVHGTHKSAELEQPLVGLRKGFKTWAIVGSSSTYNFLSIAFLKWIFWLNPVKDG